MKTTQTTNPNRPNLDNIIKDCHKPLTNTDRAIIKYLLTTQDPYNRPQKAVYCVLRAKIRDSGLTMYIELQNSTRADQDTANESKLLADLDQAEQTAKHLEKTLANLEKISKDIKSTDEDRTRALAEIPSTEHELGKVKSTIQALTDRLAEATTFSNRQDLLQVAYIQDHINRTTPPQITAEHLATIGKTEGEPLTIDEWATLQARANFSAICKAVNRYMATLPQAQTMDRVKKKYIAQTQEQANEWASLYGGIGKDIKVHQPRKRTRNSECFATMEYHDTKTRKGFYKVLHYLTVAPITYIEQYTNEEGKSTLDNLIKYRAESHEPTAQNISTADTHTALLKEVIRLNKDTLTKRQAEFLKTFLSLATYGDKCKEYYISHKQGAQTTAQAEKWAYKQRVKKAFELMQITNTETQRKTLYRLSQAIKPRATAKSNRQELTPILIPTDYKTTTEHTYTHTAPSIADIVKWHTDTTAEPKAIQWQTKAQAEESKARARAEAEEQAKESKINNGTLWAEYTAHFSELRYKLHQANPNRKTLDRLTPKEIEHYYTKLTKHRQRVKARADRRARAEQQAKARAEQDRKNEYYKILIFNYRHDITAEQRQVFDRLPFTAQVKKALAEKTA